MKNLILVFRMSKWIDNLRSIYYTFSLSSILYYFQNVNSFNQIGHIFFGLAIALCISASIASSEIFYYYIDAENQEKTITNAPVNYVKDYVYETFMKSSFKNKLFSLLTNFSFLLIGFLFFLSYSNMDKNKMDNQILDTLKRNEIKDSLIHQGILSKQLELSIQLDSLKKVLKK